MEQDKPESDTDLKQQIYHLKQENALLKLTMEHDQKEVEAAKKFLKYIQTDFTNNIPDVFKLHDDRHWDMMGKQ